MQMGKQAQRRGKNAEKRLRVRSIRQDPPNVERLTGTLLDMAMRRAAQEQEAQVQQAEAERNTRVEVKP
jgi:hypothetical protein